MPGLTPDSELELLFPARVIPDSVRNAMHPDVHIRPLASTDYHRGHLAVLSVLTAAPDPGAHAWESHFRSMLPALPSITPSYYSVVLVDKNTDRLIGVGMLFVERKFIHNLTSVGHIEDIAVDKSQQGKKLGLRIIQALTGISEAVGCYKTILNCSDSNIPFYEKCGFVKKENEMAKYAPTGLGAAPPTISRAHTPRL